jgi:hypothetical protein
MDQTQRLPLSVDELAYTSPRPTRLYIRDMLERARREHQFSTIRLLLDLKYHLEEHWSNLKDLDWPYGTKGKPRAAELRIRMYLDLIRKWRRDTSVSLSLRRVYVHRLISLVRFERREAGLPEKVLPILKKKRRKLSSKQLAARRRNIKKATAARLKKKRAVKPKK